MNIPELSKVTAKNGNTHLVNPLHIESVSEDGDYHGNEWGTKALKVTMISGDTFHIGANYLTGYSHLYMVKD